MTLLAAALDFSTGFLGVVDRACEIAALFVIPAEVYFWTVKKWTKGTPGSLLLYTAIALVSMTLLWRIDLVVGLLDAATGAMGAGVEQIDEVTSGSLIR